MVLDSILTQDLKKKAYSLESIGIEEYAWEHKDVHCVLSLLRQKKRGVVGGDVLTLDHKNMPYYTYQHWNIEPEVGETNESFIKKSHEITHTYINEIEKKNVDKNKKLLYVICPNYDEAYD